jgi:hypothetical protein
MLEYVAKMASAHHLATQEDPQRLRDVGFSDAEILHVLYWVAHFNMANTLADGVGREVHENMTAVFVDDAKDPRWARAEVERLGIRYPVVLDPTFRRVSGSNNRYWPATYVIDRKGFVRFREYGPGGFDGIEAQVLSLSSESEASTPAPVIEGLSDDTWVRTDTSPELYATFYIGARSELGGVNGAAADFAVPVQVEPHRLYLAGLWIRRDDGMELAAGIGRCVARYHAREVFLLVSPGPRAATLVVTLDGKPVSAPDAGQDLDVGSRVRVGRPGILSLIAHTEPQTHQLQIEFDEPGVVVHRLSFLPFRGDLDS